MAKPIPLEHAQDLGRLLDALVDDIVQAHAFLGLRQRLMDAIRRSPTLFPESNTFWSISLDAIEWACLLYVCRIYDGHRMSLSLSNLIATMRANLSDFGPEPFRMRLKGNPHAASLAEGKRVPDPDGLSVILDILDPEQNPTIDYLMKHRNKRVAHRDWDVVLGRSDILADSPLTWSDVSGLVRFAQDTVNASSNLYRASTSSWDAVGIDDYSRLLELAESGLGKSEPRAAS